MTEPASIQELLAQMTLEEKVGQLNLAPDENRVDEDLIRRGGLGGVICSNSAYAGNDKQKRVRVGRVNELQRIAVEESRLKIPLLVGRDVIHGHRTVAPIPIGQACSWSPQDVENCGRIASREAVADGIRWVYTPMLDIARDPRWGRVAEGYGEDPYLTSVLARAAVKGLQQVEDGRLSVAACAKHFAGYGTVEGGRDYNTGEVGPFTMRNIYLPPFKAAVEAGVATIMTCFNDLSGVPVTSNPAIARSLLKEEWGFDGFTVSDWGAVAELILHGLAGSLSEAAELAIKAGIDMDMASDAYVQVLAGLIKSGVVASDLVDEAVLRILKVKERLGLFENPYTEERPPADYRRKGSEDKPQETGDRTPQTINYQEQNKLETLQTVRKSAVLLKNDGVLPLSGSLTKIGLFGPFVEERAALLGTWCLDGDPDDVVSVLEGCRQIFGEQRLRTADLPDESINAARFCDVAVVCVGESPTRSGEANSVASLSIPAGQLGLMQGIHRVGIPIVAVVFSGRPLDLSWLEENADAVLFMYHPGLYGGLAVAEILDGRVCPSGRLPITFPRSVGQVPIYYNHRATGRPLNPYERGATRYVDERDSPLYPFGYGLTYGQVKYENLSVSLSAKTIQASCTLRNESKCACEEVAQLYIRDVVACAARPIKELKGFERTYLAPGESKTVSFELGEEELGYYGPDEKWRFEPGEFVVWIGPDSVRGLSEKVMLSF